MRRKEIRELCEKAVADYNQDHRSTNRLVFFHAGLFKDAIYFRDYIRIKYPDVKTMVMCQGFVYNEEFLNNLLRQFPVPQN